MNKPENINAFTDLNASHEQKKWLDLMDFVSAMPDVIEWRKTSAVGLGLKAGMSVLDVGCGLGNATRILAEHLSSGKIIGLDASDAMIQAASQRSTNPIIKFQVGDAMNLEFPDNSFDAVYAERILHHLKNPEKALQEFYRVLKPGGRLCLLDPYFSSCSISPLSSDLTADFAKKFCKTALHGDIGLDLLCLTKLLNLKEILFKGWFVIFRDFELVSTFLPFSDFLEEKDIEPMKRASKENTFVFAIPTYQLISEK